MSNVSESTPEATGTGAAVVPADAIQVVRHGHSGKYTLLIAGARVGSISRGHDTRGFWLDLSVCGIYWIHKVNSKQATVSVTHNYQTLEPRFKDALALAVRTLKEFKHV